MMYVKAIFLLIIGGSLAQDGTVEFPEVRAPVGRIRGTTMTSRLGRKFSAFRGVRYAEPPVGELRFQPAVPAADWNDVFDATKEGPACPQPVIGNTDEEDCLRLNVYTSKLPSGNAKGGHPVKRSVMVFFHPGGFYGFSAQSSLFGPQYLMDKDIVLVTANYRLSTLGFISTGDAVAPGNLGLKDQVAVLRWVKRNIAAFGGNPDSVTLAGYSAGSMSNILHMLSPMSKGLFHRVIASSASPTGAYPLPTNQTALAVKQAEFLGCPTDTSQNIINCLKTKPWKNFSDTMPQFFEWEANPVLIWSPVVEPDIPGVERFLTDQPVNLIRQGKIHQVPLISGITKDEFGGSVAKDIEQLKAGNAPRIRELNENWYTLAPIVFAYERNTTRSREISDELRNFYLHGQPITLENIKGLEDLLSDTITTFSQYRATKLLAKHSRAPVYFYEFTENGRYSFFMNNSASHHDDLQYLFYISFQFPFTKPTDPEAPMIEIMTSMWSNFVETGEPIPKNQDFFKNITWERYCPQKDNYLDINLHPTMRQGFYPERMQEMEKLFPLPPPQHSSVKH